MTIESEAPVTVIEGIGPRSAGKLAAHGVHFVLDLLRATPAALHGMVAATHSEEQTRRWRVQANLLEVEPMTAQWAEALVHSGVETVEELSRRDIQWLAQAFDAVHASGRIPGTPSIDEIGQMKRDAAVLFYTGSLMGTVLGSNGVPVAGATVRLGFLETTTNSRGRFRMTRIPLGTSPALEIRAPDHAVPNPGVPNHRVLVAETPTVIADPEAVVVQIFQLEAANGAVAPSPRLRELDGDLLPAMRGLPVRTERQDRSHLQKGDVFMVQKFYQRQPDALLVSRFRDYQAGEFIVRTARVPVAELPSGVQVKDHVTLRTSGFESVEFGPLKHQLALGMRRFEKHHPLPSSSLSGAEHRARTLARLDFLKAEGLFGHPPENP